MRLRDILLAWAQAGSPDPGQYEVQLVPSAPGASPAAPPAAQPAQPAAFGAALPTTLPAVPGQFYPAQPPAGALPAATPPAPFPGAVPGAIPGYTGAALPYLAQPSQGDATFAAERTARLTAEAQLFYRDQLAAKKVVPAEAPHIVQRYLQAARDDAEHGLAVFANGQQYSRVDALRAEFAAKPALAYTQELVGGHLPQGASVLGPQFGTDPMAAVIQQATDSAKAYAQRVNGRQSGGAA